MRRGGRDPVADDDDGAFGEHPQRAHLGEAAKMLARFRRRRQHARRRRGGRND
jgi:hypothetical protein